MATVERLDKKNHADLRILAGHSPALGDAARQIAVLPTEFESAQRSYPILFTRDPEGKLHSVAVIGFTKDENLFLEGGRWDGYVPAVVRRGPFIIGPKTKDGGEPIVLVDVDHARVRRGGEEGMPVFTEDGEKSKVLEGSLHALRQLHLGRELAATMEELFTELDLFEPLNLKLQIAPKQVVNFDGYMVVSAAKLAKLTGKQLEKLSKARLLAPAIFASSSIHNMQRLVTRRQRKLAEAAAAKDD